MFLLVITREIWWKNQEWSEIRYCLKYIRYGRSAKVALFAYLIAVTVTVVQWNTSVQLYSPVCQSHSILKPLAYCTNNEWMNRLYSRCEVSPQTTRTCHATLPPSLFKILSRTHHIHEISESVFKDQTDLKFSILFKLQKWLLYLWFLK